MLLVRTSVASDVPGVWQLPGGDLAHAEHPAEAVVRSVAEETGLNVEVAGVRAVVADVLWLPGPDIELHTDRIVYDVRPRTGVPVEEHAVAWVPPQRLRELPLMPFTAEVLGLPVNPLPPESPRVRASATAQECQPELVDRRQRFGAYALATDPNGRVLLAMIAPGYPGAGHWHLPGGGTDHGEQPIAALLRELVEETGQLGRVIGLLDVNSLHNLSAFGPEGRPLNWHSVRAVYRVMVETPTEPTVTELQGGSTARAAWFTADSLPNLPLSDLAAAVIGQTFT